MRWLWLGFLLAAAVPVHADQVDEGWRACQGQRDVEVWHGRPGVRGYKAALKTQCEAIAAQMQARPPAAAANAAEVEAAAKAAIEAAKK